jgi:small subunit ribosomal protein S14
VAKKSIIQREEKREKLVAKYAKKYAELKAITDDAQRSDEERYVARLELQKLPRNANPTRLRSRCALTGHGRGTRISVESVLGAVEKLLSVNQNRP